MFRILLISTGFTCFVASNANAQGKLGKMWNKMKEKSESNSSSSGSSSSTETAAKPNNFTEFQQSKLGQIIFFTKDRIDVDWTGETAADCATEAELGKPLVMRTYIKNSNDFASGKDRLDIRFTVGDITMTGFEFSKYAYDIVEKADRKQTFGNFWKYENSYPCNSITGAKNSTMITPTLMAPKGQYWAQLTGPEDCFRFFVQTKLKHLLVPGKSFKVKVELFRANEIFYAPSKTQVPGEVYASGEINIKVTDHINQYANSIFRMGSEGLVDKEVSAATAKEIEKLHAVHVKKVHKVMFTDNDYKISKNPSTGITVSRTIEAWVYFENHDGNRFVTLTKLTYMNDGGANFLKTPDGVHSNVAGASFPVFGNPKLL